MKLFRIVLALACLLGATSVFPLGMSGVRGGGGSGGSSSLVIQEIDGAPTGTPGVLKFSNGAVTNNGDGSFTVVTGAGGGGDFSSNTTTSADSEMVLFSGTGGKTGKRSLFALAGPASTLKTYTFPNANATMLTDQATVTVAQGGTGTGTTLAGIVRGGSPMTAAELSGDVTSVTGNVTTIQPGAVTYSKMQNTSVGSVLLGRGSTGAGSPQEITLGTNLSMSGTTLNATAGGGVTDGDKGEITVSSSGTVWTIDNSAVTYAKLQSTAAGSVLLGRSAGTAGVLGEVILGRGLTFTGSTLNSGSAFTFLASQQAGADNCVKIQAAIDLAVGAGGGVAVGDFTGAYTCTAGFTVRTGTTLFLMPSVITVGATVQVQDYARLLGQSTSANTGATTIIKAGTNLNANILLLQSVGGAGQWWHGGEVGWIRIDGNGANQTTPASCVNMRNPGENSDFHSVLITQCSSWALEISGISSGSTAVRQVSIFSNQANGATFFNGVTGSLSLDTFHLGGSIGPAITCKAASGGFNLILKGVFQIEGFSIANATAPDMVVFDGTSSICNLYGQTIGASGVVGGVNVFTRINGAGSTLPSINFFNVGTANYTNLYQDQVTGYTIPAANVTKTNRVTEFHLNVEAALLGPAIALVPFFMPVANGNNHDVSMRCRVGAGQGPACTHAIITAPTAAFTITGMVSTLVGVGAVDGAMAILENQTAQIMTLANQNTGSGAGNRITTGTGADYQVKPGATAILFYNAATTSWQLQRVVMNLATDASGILPVANGGTGNTTGLATGVANADYGDITVSGATTWTIDPGVVTYAKLQNVAAASKLLGSGSAGAGASPTEITLGTNLSMSGTTLNATAGAGGYATIQDEGSGLTARSSLNFIGAGVTCVDNAGGSKTDCTIPGGSGSPGGSSGQVQYNNAGAFGGTTGQIVDGTQILSTKLRATSITASTTLTTSHGPVISCDPSGATDVTLTLPAASTTGQGSLRIVKGTSNAGNCIASPNGTDTLNYVNGTKTITARGDTLDLSLSSTTNWIAQTGKVAINLTTDVTGTLPVANGGTGAATLTGVLLGNGTGAVTGVTTSAGLLGAMSDETGSGSLVFNGSPTLTTPMIASFTNATHNHTNAAGGGQLTDAALSSAVTVAKGGTGLTTGTSGGVPYFNATSTMASSGALSANQLVLGGGAGASPSTPVGLGTTTTVLHGNAAGAPSFGTVSLTADVSGTLPVASGGTGNTTGNATTATALAANGANCTAGQFPLGVDASGAVESCTALPTTITGTTNQITASASTGAITLSTPQDIGTASAVQHGRLGLGVAAPATAGMLSQTAGANAITLQTLKRNTDTTPTGNFVDYQSAAAASLWTVDITGSLAAGTVPGARVSGNITGNAGTATALAANGANCSAGQFPLGVDASGAVENCTALPTTITGTTNQITASASTGAITLSIPTNPTLPGTTTATINGNASTATALAANGTNCSAGQAAAGVDASGNAEGCFTPSGGGGGYNAIQEEGGTALTARTTLNFIGAALTAADNAGQTRTDVTLSQSPASTSVVGTGRTISTTAPLGGGGDLSADRTITCTTCTTNAAALTANQLTIGGGGNANAALGSSGTTTQVLHGNAAGAPTFSAVSLTADVTGTLPVANGGTGNTTGNAATATALAANGGNCAAQQFATGVDASGVAEGCAALATPSAKTTTYTVTTADFAAYTTFTVASGTFTITLPVNTGMPASGSYIRVVNYGTGVVTIARNGQNINGAAANLTLPASSASDPSSSYIISDGTNYFATIEDGTVSIAKVTGGTQLVASGTLALTTSAIASAACTAAQTATATGTLTTDVVTIGFNGDPTAVTGYIPATAGMLTIIPYPTSNTVNVKVCNNTSASITPGAITLNYRVIR